MDVQLDGATRLYGVVGDPIAQVKSPAGLTGLMVAKGANAVLVPMHVHPQHFSAFMRAARDLQNLDGLVLTVPHKIPVTAFLETMSDRARFLGAANIIRRVAPGGGWHGDATDGFGFVNALKASGFEPKGRKALLVGAGGAGSAIGLALVEAGVAVLAIHDTMTERRDALIRRLTALGEGEVRVGSPDPSGFDLAANATPTGMGASDPLPIDAGRLERGTFAADVITAPLMTPFLTAALARGCRTQTGAAMFDGQADYIVDFLLAAAR